MPLRRSLRTRANVNYDLGRISIYPDGPATTDLEKLLHSLNLQSFSASAYARIDDILVFALFATKARQGNYRALDTTPVTGEREITATDGRMIATICSNHISTSEPTYNECLATAEILLSKYPDHFLAGDREVITHLLLRYSLLHSAHSLVKVEKIMYAGIICAGLQAQQDIAPSTFILTASGSMSFDLCAKEGGLSVIESTAKQLGPSGIRLILGPFRFANHECKPNCQIYPIASTHAFVLISLYAIKCGESITVAYTKDGYHDPLQACLCSTCKPRSPPLPPKRNAVDESKFVPGLGKKKHRGGKRAKRRLLNKNSEE